MTPRISTAARLFAAAAALLMGAAMTVPARAAERPAPPAKSKPAAKAPAKKTAAAKTVAKPPALTQRDKEIFARAMKAALKRDWRKARAAIADTRNPLLNKVVEWAILRDPGPHASFEERTAFVAANPKWPSVNEMRRRAEGGIDDAVPLSTLSAWFAAHPPLSTAGKVAYARALRAEGKAQEAHALAREAWISDNLNRDDERAILRAFEDILTPDDHWARIDLILYDEQTSAADRLLDYISPERARVARARIKLIDSGSNVDAAVAAVPKALQNDPGLLYDRVKWRLAHIDEVAARELVPDYALGGPRPDLWWRVRHILARDALGEGSITEAYKLAKHYGATDALSVSEAEWLAGWIALRFLKDGETALAHFEKVYDSVQTPPSLARGAYWTGRTTEFLGRADLAADWYQRAATYVTTYYGQLALARLHGENVPLLPQDPTPTPEERAIFNANELTQALRALLEVDAKPYQRAFAQALADNSDQAVDRFLTAELVSKSARVDLGVVIARNAAREKITLVQYGYPTPAYKYPDAPEKALILAITRQESNFDPAALSSAGARGLMQLMPGTAKGLARREKIAYVRKKLTDPAYNMRLGAAFLEDLVDDFDGSYILAAAAYNAGPSRARQWVRQYGDPRDKAVDAVDWIEQLPFGETRNYVQRVMENVMIYRTILSGGHRIPKTLEAELVRQQ